ncbi:3-dehydroquinate synthase, partial [Francisella tularensis subsp. holarctica]|nr:3-dehydroquinate synthase [Francisella tularensis subsp. holarctica]
MISKLTVNPTFSPSYNIIVDSVLDFSHIIEYVTNKQVLVFTNTNVEKLNLTKILEAEVYDLDVRTFILEDVDQYKSQQSLYKILSTLLENHFTRNSTVLVALGGGVIGDITGFAAAIYQRGIDFIQI